MKVGKITTALFSSAMLLMSGCGGKGPAQAVAEYDVLKLEKTEREVSLCYSASIRGQQDIDIYPQVSGKLVKLCVKEGQVVHTGQVLFIVDQVPYRAALNTALANLESAKAQLATAQLNYNSRKKLFQEKVVSDFDLQTARNTYLTAKAGVSQAEATLTNARNNLSYTEVKSAGEGSVGTIPYRVGSLVGPSMAKPLTTVSDNSKMYVYFSVAENQLLALLREYGSREKVLKEMPNVKLKLNDQSIYELEGRVETISGVVDPNTGAVSVRAVFMNPKGILYSGTSGNVVIPIKKEGVVIPKSTTFEIQDKCYAYKVVDGKSASAMITVENVDNPREFLVTSGLEEGDVILAEGVGTMREGTPIVAKQQTASAQQPQEEVSK
ncbi:MAG TPA: efflux RND transporter periplasmic adaptor subunit [Porphyromonadaceae bacterium]|nr:efflux RND transporter periplasmic adaptor subunit [Porphyromonadaceae bacterium]